MSSFTISPTETAWLSARHHRAVRAGVLGDLHGSSSLGAKLFRYRRSILAGCLLLAIANTLTIYGIQPKIVKNQLESVRADYDRWNSFSRVTVTRSNTDIPAMWGPSPRLPPWKIEQRWLLIDGSAGSIIYRFDGNFANLGFLRQDVSNLAYAIPNFKTAAVIGVGGGRDVLSQRLFGVPDVTGIEINPIINRYLGAPLFRLHDDRDIAGSEVRTGRGT